MPGVDAWGVRKGWKADVPRLCSGMDVDLARLAQDVREELDGFVVPAPDPTALGAPLPLEWYASELAEMRKSLVTPYWAQIRDLDPDTRCLVILKAVVVADDEGNLVAFDPQAQGEFVLALRDPDPDRVRGADAVSCGVRGDAVGCFVSR